MNGRSKRLLGWAGGAAALALVAGITPASADLVTTPIVINPTGTNGSADLAPGPGNGTFAASGGTGWANMGATLSSATAASGVSYTAWGSVDIIHFTADFTCAQCTPGNTHTGVGNDSAGNEWTFFATTSVTGQGGWSGGVFTATSASVTAYLWAAQGNLSSSNFGGANITDSAFSLTTFTNLGFNNPSAVVCSTGAQSDANNCLLVAQATSQIPGVSTFSIDDSFSNDNFDTMTFNIAGVFSTASYAQGTVGTGAGSALFVTPPDPTSFGLVVISGCEAAASTISINDTDAAPAFFHTTTQQQGNAPCNSNSNTDQSHDPVGWDFLATSVPEPASLALLGVGLVGIGLANRRRRRAVA